MQYNKKPVPRIFPFKDKTREYFTTREIYNQKMAVIENMKRKRLYDNELRAYNRKLNAGETEVEPPTEPKLVDVPELKANDQKFVYKNNEVSEPVYNFMNEMSAENALFVHKVSSRAFDERQHDGLNRSEVLEKVGKIGYTDKFIEEKKDELLKEAEEKERVRQAEFNKLKPRGVRAKLKALSVDGWILVITRIFKSLDNIVWVLDNDVKFIALNSNKLVERGMSTLRQLEELALYQERKEQYLNIYVLNQMFAGLLNSDLEREVFMVVMQKLKDLKQIESQKLRTAYRLRRNILKRFREFCLVRGMDSEWFYSHFAFLPAVQYFIENHDVDKRLDELKTKD